MAASTIKITFESLLETIANLGQVEKRKLWEYLDSELSEEELDEQTIANIEVAYSDYAAGDYLTIQEYRAQRLQRST